MKGAHNMPTDNLIQLTVRVSPTTKEEIEDVAKHRSCSTSEVLRLLIDDRLKEYQNEVQYVDEEQGRNVIRLLGNVYDEIANIRKELNRIGVNYNQEIKLQQTEKAFAEKRIDVAELIRTQSYIRKECNGFTPDMMNKIMDRYEQISKEVTENIMCYTRISPTKNGKAAIAYARGLGYGHNGHAKRNLLVGSVGMLPDEITAFEEQMEWDWVRRASPTNVNQIRRIVASFSQKELESNDTDSAYTALEIAQEFVKEAYPNRKAAIFVQNDGVGEKLHLHILVSNVDSIEYKGCTNEQTRYDYVEREFDKIASKYIKLDFGEKAKEKLSQKERVMREENEEAIDNGEEPQNCIWKDVLRNRILMAMMNTETEDDFLNELENQGVSARYGQSKKYGTYLSYELVDIPESMKNSARKLKARSYTLGDNFGIEALRATLKEKSAANALEQEKTIEKTATETKTETIAQSNSDTKQAASKPSAFEKLKRVRDAIDIADRERRLNENSYGDMGRYFSR